MERAKESIQTWVNRTWERREQCQSSNSSFGEAAEHWLSYVKKTRKYSTYMKYVSIYECHIKELLKDAAVSDISNRYISQTIFFAENEKIISPSLKHSILAVINQVLQYANEIYGCPLIKLKNKSLKESNRPVEIINRTEQALLIRYLYQEINLSKAGIILCISTGLRLGEICSLKWNDIDFEQMVIHVNSTVQRIAVKDKETKTELMETSPKSIFSMREIPLSNAIRQLLYPLRLEGQEYLLCGKKPMEPRTYQNHFKRYLKDLKIRQYNFHVLRHTFATNCIDNGMDIKSLSEILGHSDVQITLNRYVHPTMDTKRKHINALSKVYGRYCGHEEDNISI